MKYADATIALLSAFPGREFSVRHIVRQVNPKARGIEANTIRNGVRRVLCALEGMGKVEVSRRTMNGSNGTYRWIEPGYGLHLHR